MTSLVRPADQAARDLISSTGLNDTLFVEAGAGTGKTTQLVDRIVTTVLRNDVALADIAAITFTEAAATELQSRIRVAFEERLADDETSGDVRERCRSAVADADLAAISTVHGFASRILNEFSVAAGLPPRVTVLDEVSSQLANERRWTRFVDRLHDDPDHEELLYRAALMEIPLQPRWHGQTTFKEVAAEFAQNWDRLVDVTNADRSAELAPLDFTPFDTAIDELAASLASCTDPADKLAVHLDQTCLPEMRALASIVDPHQKLRAIGKRLRASTKRRIWTRTGLGSKKSWSCDPAVVKDLIEAVSDAAIESFDLAGVAVVDRLVELTASEVLAAANERRRDGGLEFHDLLVLARQALRRNPEVRRSLHDRYRHILLDEFQDTDPIQIEVASLIASDPAEVQPERWQDHPVGNGRLFFVGDPKQSIYRFRRADITLFLAARDAFGQSRGPVSLRTNFRTVAPIIEWINAMFAEVMPDEIADAQPKYEPLDAWRIADSGADHRPVVFGGAHPDPKVKAGALREAEAADVARIVADIVERSEAWPVLDERSKRWRPASLSDVTILIPTRTSLPYLREALEGEELPYRLATGTLVYDTQEVRDVLAALRAIDDPNDTLSLIAALRSPLYGCSDIDLFEYHDKHRRWDLRSPTPDGLDDQHPVVVALAHLRSLWDRRWWTPPATMMDRLLRERRAFVLAFGDPRPHEVWRRLRFLLDQARAFEESNGGDLRSFLEWASLQSADGARVHEPMLPETDDDALQILTVHGSKGLEFPITILSGMTTQSGGNRSGVSVLWGESGPPEVKLRGGVATAAHQPRADLEEEMGSYEKLRLLYVAATRARDHLIVSGHHKAPPKRIDDTFATRVSGFRDGYEELCRPHRVAEATPGAAVQMTLEVSSPERGVEPASEDIVATRNEWVQRRAALAMSLAVPTTLSATAIAAVVDAGIVDVDDDSRMDGGPDATSPTTATVRRKGRAGSSIGRAVHATLEYIDFADPADLRELVERQCDLETIPEHADTVEALTRSALRSEAVQLATRHEFHRELYVGAPLGDIMVEGYVDLLIRTPDGLVIVDYKTDTASTPADIDAKIAAYELQAATYAVALETTTGIDVVDCRFVFCQIGEAIERSVADVEEAKLRVRDAVGVLGSA